MSTKLAATLAIVAIVSASPAGSRAADRLVGTTCQELYDNCVAICNRQGFPGCQDCPNGKKSCDSTGIWRSYFATIPVPPGRPK
jgi:hypothetical protein